MRAVLKRWLKSRRRTTTLYTDTELGCVVDAGIARARENIAKANATRKVGGTNLHVANATVDRINADRALWMAAGTQARYVELHRLANHEAAAFIRHYEAREHA